MSNATMRKSYKKKCVMIFGVFDGLHPGHRAFLKQAKRHDGKLIAVVARDSTAKKLKGKMPKESERKRLAAVRKVREVSRAILGDIEQGSYGVIKKYEPDIICLGYDQKWLEKDLRIRMRRRSIPVARLIRLKSYRPDKFKSSKFNSPDK